MAAGSNYRALAKKVATMPERIVRAGADEMRQAVITQLKADTGGDQMLSGFVKRARRKVKLSTTVKITGGRALATATVEASPKRARGMWTVLESGTVEREVGRLRRKTSGPGGKHMKVGGGDDWRTGPWSVGRSPAKHTFSEGVFHGTAPAERAMADLWQQTVNHG